MKTKVVDRGLLLLLLLLLVRVHFMFVYRKLFDDDYIVIKRIRFLGTIDSESCLYWLYGEFSYARFHILCYCYDLF